MSNDSSTPTNVGSNAELGQDHPERAAFARWCRENGHGELDDMLTPLDRSLRTLMWPVWKGAVAAERERWRDEALRFDREPPADCPHGAQCLARGACWKKCSLTHAPNARLTAPDTAQR